MNREIVVAAGVAPGRLDVYLAAQMGISRSAASALIKGGHVTAGGVIAKASHEVQTGQIFVVAKADEPAAFVSAPDLPVVYQDDDVIVVDKPAGIVVHAGNGQVNGGTVADFARPRTTDDDPDRPGIVHRLDKDTSGLLVIAKSAAAKAALQAQWRDRSVAKTYQALVVGHLEPPAAIIDLPIDRDQATPTKQAISANGRPAITHYHTLDSYDGYSLVEANPKTGRTHQIRVHFASVGHPVAGDIIYGSPKRPLGLTRQFLHAAALSFTTPSGQRLNLRSALPPELTEVLNRLREQGNTR